MQSKARPARNADPAQRRTILLVDDQPIILRALRRVFRNEGYNVLSATGAAAALDILGRVPCDLIIADYLMPEMNGVELIAKVKERWPGIACIMLTGHADLEALAGFIRRGELCKFALKPWNDRDLRVAVADALAAGCAGHPAREGSRV